jgi:hypothetical protein
MKVLCKIILLSLSLSGCAGLVIKSNEREQLSSNSIITKEQLRLEKGEPSRIEGDVWVYELNSNNWVGVVPFIIVPIPLVLPLSEERIEYEFTAEGLKSATLYTTRMKGGICGIVPEGHGLKLGCFKF